MRMASAKVLQNQIEAWNKHNPVGTAVLVSLDSGELRPTKTTSQAQVLGGHSAVVWLEGISGCYLLARVTPIIA